MTYPANVGKRMLIALSLVVIMLLAACGPAAEPDPDEAAPVDTDTEEPEATVDDAQTEGDEAAADAGQEAPPELVEAAQAEGRVIYWAGVPNPAAIPFVESFEEKYGIEVEFERQISSVTATQFDAMMEGGGAEVDVIQMNNGIYMRDVADKGWILNPTSEEVPALEGWPEEWRYASEGATYNQAVGVYTLGYNTEFVSEEDVPTEWTDLLDPRWRGRIMINDPRVSVSVIASLDSLAQEFGTDFLENFGAQELLFTDSNATGIQSVAAGEAWFMFPSAAWISADLKAEGAPIEDVYIDPPIGGADQWIAVAADSPNPSAAALLFNYALSDEGQAAMCTNLCSSVTGAPGTDPFPDGYTSQDLEAAAEREEEVLGHLGLR